MQRQRPVGFFKAGREKLYQVRLVLWRFRFRIITLLRNGARPIVPKIDSEPLPFMKTSNVLVLCLALTAIAAQAQVGSSPGTTVPAPTPYQVVDIGPNQSIWQCQSFEQMPNGQMMPHTHTYTALASGLNYQDPSTGQYLPSQNTIEAFAGGAIVRRNQNQIIFANNLNSPGAVDVQTQDHNRLRSNILGLLYVDPATGQAVQIGGIQDSEGELIANNEVLYQNAFAGVTADVLYKTRLDG